MVDIRVTRDVGLSVLDVKAPVRVTRLQGLTTFFDRTNPIRITRVQGQTVYNDRTNPIRVTRFVAQLVMSMDELPPVQPDRNQILNREANPFRPVAPKEIVAVSPLLHDFITEQTAQIRQTHDSNQAGDSTVPWEFLTKIGSQKLYTLGSLGKFYHDDFGIVLARYCQFSKIKTPLWLNGPVGLIAKSNAVDWQVTNDLSLSSPDAVVGILCSYTPPAQGDYGWVLTQGANIVPLLLQQNVKTLEKNQPFVWSDFEKVSPDGKGRILGRAIGPLNFVNKGQLQIDAGGAMIHVEGPSIDSLKASIGTDGLDAKIAIIDQAVKDLGGDALAKSVATLKVQMAEAQQGIKAESGRAIQAETDINLSIAKILAALGGSTLAALYLQITNEQAEINAIQDTQIGRVLAKAQSALDIVTQLVNANFQHQIDQLKDRLVNQVSSSLIPLVDGSIPPVLVYLPTGELVFVEVTL